MTSLPRMPCHTKMTGEGTVEITATQTTYRCNKTIATATSRFIVTAAIVVYKGLIPVVYRMLTEGESMVFASST